MDIPDGPADDVRTIDGDDAIMGAPSAAAGAPSTAAGDMGWKYVTVASISGMTDINIFVLDKIITFTVYVMSL